MRSLWLLILLAFPVVTLAHDETTPATPTLTVSETGIVQHAPDMAFATFGLETASKSDLPPIWWTPGYATAALASNSAGDR